jgi:hypothetical protein
MTVVLARSGQLEAARRGRALFSAAGGRENELGVLDGEILAASGHPREAISALRDAMRLIRLEATPVYFLGVERLSTLLAADGQTAEAIERLRAVADAGGRTYAETGSAGAFWLRDVRLLEQLESRAGHPAEAARARAVIQQAHSLAQ